MRKKVRAKLLGEFVARDRIYFAANHQRTLRKAMASAPHCVTTSVSLVSLVKVKAKMIKNLMEPIKRNLVTSFSP
jgi:hypothetical protein